MTKHLLAFFALCLGGLFLTQSATAGEIKFSYASGDTLPWGNNKLETYDVAMFVPGSSLKGKKIKQITIPCRASVATNISVWLSSKLALTTIDNVKCADADILRVPVENTRTIVVDLETPYEVTEDGVYVGYTLTIPSGSIQASDKTNPGRYPITVTEGATENGFFIHNSRTYTTWKSAMQLNIKYTADISLLVEGDFHDYSVAVNQITSCLSKIDTPSETTVTLANHGTVPVSSIDYVLTAGTVKEEGTLNFPAPIPPSFNHSYDYKIAVPAVPSVGHYDLKFEVTKVNGQPNEDSDASASSWIDVPSFYPTHRPVMEEYTALGCGYCPQGYVALKWMNENYEDFIGISYHCDFSGVRDSMSCVPSNYWWGYPGSLPSAVLDRQTLNSPYSGNTNYHMGIAYTWEDFAEVVAPCDIFIESEWSDDNSALDITLTAKFMTSHTKSDYRFAYFIIADSVSGPGWYQVNYCNQGSFLQYPAELGWTTFTKGASKVYGLVFDDIALASPTPTGVVGSIPSDIIMDQQIKWHTTFELSSVSRYNYLIHDRGANLRIVGAVIDGSTGHIVNGNKIKAGLSHDIPQPNPDAVEVTLNNSAEVISETLFDLNGREVKHPANGIYVRAQKLSDGTVRTSKVAF